MVPTGREGPGEERDQDEFVVHSGDDGDDGAVRVVGGEREDEDILGFEPIQALEGGIDGFNVYSKIVKKSSMLLKIGGKLVFEIGFDQKFEMLKLLNRNNFFVNKIVKDYGGRDRCVICTKL